MTVQVFCPSCPNSLLHGPPPPPTVTPYELRRWMERALQCDRADIYRPMATSSTQVAVGFGLWSRERGRGGPFDLGTN